MTDEERQRLHSEVRHLRTRVDALEEESEKLRALPEAVAELKGMVVTLSSLITTGFSSAATREDLDRAAGIKTAIAFASVVLVPILVAVIGGYFALKGATSK